MTRRDLGQKEFVPLANVPQKVVSDLASMQKEMLEKARAFREQNTFEVENYADFQKRIEEPGGFFSAAWCQSKDCEAKIKEDTKATLRCLPIGPDYQPISVEGRCLACEGTSSLVRAIFARAY